jgi:hypothetical protein
VGAIREVGTGQVRALESPFVVGRAGPSQCALTLGSDYVSQFHAELRWTGQSWDMKDLNSKNGTFVDGQRLAPGQVARLTKGSRIVFGRAEQTWEVVDASRPTTMVVPLGGGESVTFDDRDMVALPSSEDPQVTLYRGNDGLWRLEGVDAEPAILVAGQIFEALGRMWRFACAEQGGGATLPVHATESPPHVADLNLLFSVSKNEEYVHLRVQRGGEEYDLGARQHHFLLLTLARHWLEDEGEPEDSRGWLNQDVLAHDPSMASSRLNLAVYRIRDQFEKAGIVDFGRIVQRRPGQIRIGTGRLEIRVV